MRLVCRKWIARSIHVLVATAHLIVASGAAYGDAITTGAQAGKDAARTFRPDPNAPLWTQDPTTGQITLAPGKGSFDGMGVGQEKFQLNELFPGATTDNSQLRSLYGNEGAMNSFAIQQHQALRGSSGGSSSAGSAYSVMQGSWLQGRPNLSNDPQLWQQQSPVQNNIGDVTKEFAECTRETTFVPGVNAAHIPDIRTCERVVDQTRNCEIVHNYKAGVLEHHAGPFNVSSCGAGCVEMWIGTIGDNYWSGNCQIYEESVTVDVYNPDAIISATLVYAKWDDYLQVWINNDKVWCGPDGCGVFPPETPGSCERETNWERNLNVDVTSQFKSEGLLKFRTRTSVSGDGEGFARIRVRFDPAKVVYEESWTPENCQQSLQGMTDSFCQGTVTCTDSPPVDGSGCAWIGGTYVCPENFDWNPSPKLNPLCRRATVNASCQFYQGDMECWTDAQGNQQCPTNNGTNLNSCTTFEDNPNCAFIRSRCVQDAAGQSGTCYLFAEEWDCGHTAEVPTVEKTETLNCPGPVRCMGMECIDMESETSADFAEAAAALSAARMIAMDTECFEGNSNNNECQIFKGDDYSCKKAVAGVVDCCATPEGGVGLGSYLSLVMGISSLDSAVGDLDPSNPIAGAWNTLTGPFDSAWSSVSKPFVSAWENIWGGAEHTPNAVMGNVVDGVKAQLTNQVAEWTAQVFGDAAVNSIFSVAGSGGPAFVGGVQQGPLQLGGGGALVGTALSWVMTAYTIYSITMILINIIFPCTQSEFELGQKKKLKSCHYVGSFCNTGSLGVCIERRESYCCFNSPLSRILQEQIRTQHGIPWGEPKAPECRGITVEELETTDFSKVDLSEWMGLLAENSLLPTGPDLTMDGLTGFGSVLNVNGRSNAADRAVDRSAPINGLGVNQDAADELRGQPLPGTILVPPSGP